MLVRAVAAADDPRLVLVVAGEGPERSALAELADELSIRLVLAGDVDWERIVELYVAADVFALLSEREPWAVVVNEAAACGLPLVLSDRVGAAHDLLRDGENGLSCRPVTSPALRRRSAGWPRDPELRRDAGRTIARARARLGIRPERRGLPRRPCAKPCPIAASLFACRGNGFSSSTSTTGPASRRPRTC